MKIKGPLLFSFILFVSIFTYAIALHHVRSIRADFKYRVRAATLPISNEVLKALVGEFRGIVADYLLLEAASFIGSPNYEEAGPEDWTAVALLLEQSSYLDPYFSQTYRLTQSTLPWHANKVEETITILERSKIHRLWDWLPSFFLGFDHYFFLKDDLTASQILMDASKISNAPVSLATLASRLASKAGQTEVALSFLLKLHEETDDENVKKIIEKRIVTLRGVSQLQSAVEEFKRLYGRLPNDLDELIEYKVLPHIPENPDKRPFSYQGGKVSF